MTVKDVAIGVGVAALVYYIARSRASSASSSSQGSGGSGGLWDSLSRMGFAVYDLYEDRKRSVAVEEGVETVLDAFGLGEERLAEDQDPVSEPSRRAALMARISFTD